MTEDKLVPQEEKGKELRCSHEYDPQYALAQADKSIQFRQGLLKLIAKKIRPTEVRMFGDNLHFERGACEQILSWAGSDLTKLRITPDRITDDKGAYIDYEAYGTLKTGDGREMELMGNCSTRDDFFGRRTDKEGNDYFLPLSEVDVPSVKQKAITNLLNHCAIRALGLKSITLNDLKEAGMDINQIGKVTFGKGKSGGATVDTDTKNKQAELGNILLSIAGGDRMVVEDMLEDITKFPGRDGKEVPGLRSCAKLTGKRLDIALGKAHDLQKRQ